MARDRIRRIVEPVPPAVLAALAVAQQARDAIPAGYTALARARVAALLEARSAGLTWRQTAGLLGISQERCHSLVREAQRGAGSVSDQAGGGGTLAAAGTRSPASAAPGSSRSTGPGRRSRRSLESPDYLEARRGAC